MSNINPSAAAARENARHTDGTFGEQTHADAGQLTFETTSDDRDWGDAGITTRSRTPWGEIQQVNRPADGVAVVDCIGHGGIKLSAERNAVIPPALRNRSGWYEEDCESYIVGMYHPEAMNENWLGGDRDAQQQQCREQVAYWFTDKYEAATGETVPVDKSNSKTRARLAADEDAWRDAHRDDWVTGGGDNEFPAGIPNGWTVSKLTRETDQQIRYVAMPLKTLTRAQDDTVGPNRMQSIPTPDRFVDVTDVIVERNRTYDQLRAVSRPIESAPVIDKIPINTTGLTAKQAETAEAEWSQLVRTPNNQVMTRLAWMESRQVRGKTSAMFSGDTATTYYLSDGRHVMAVSKAAWLAADIPDYTTDTDRARIEEQQAENAVERAHKAVRDTRRLIDNSKHQQALKKLEQAKQRAAEARVNRRAAWERANQPYHDLDQRIETLLRERFADVDLDGFAD